MARAPINPVALEWAREVSHVTLEELAKALNVKPARVAEFEGGDALPTFRQLTLMAAKLDRPLGFFAPPPSSCRSPPSAPRWTARQSPRSPPSSSPATSRSACWPPRCGSAGSTSSTTPNLEAIRFASDENWQRVREAQKQKEGFVPPWRLRYRDLGPTYIGAVAHALADRRVDLVDATYLLNARLPIVEQLLDEYYRTGGAE